MAGMDIRSHPQVKAFQEAAVQYCALLESAPSDVQEWVISMLAAVARLYACAHQLPELPLPDDAVDVPDIFDVDDAEWGKVCGVVRDALGLQCYYWSYFDPSVPQDETPYSDCGDLADDLADIYRDVKPGLRAWASGNDGYLRMIVFDWKVPLFPSHWGVHAVDAMRALHPIAYLRGVQSDDAANWTDSS
jgi:Domain of unknown function (DUF5063)